MAGEFALLELGVLFAALAVVGAVATRIRQSVVPLYILVGILLNQHVSGQFTSYALSETDFVAVGAELGIVFLLLFLGFEFNLQRLLENHTRMTRAGIVDLAVNFGVGFVLGYVLFGALLPAFLVAGIVYISSSAIISKSLIDQGWIANDEASPILGTLVFEDLVIAGYLVLASALLLGSGDLVAAAEDMVVAVGFILVLFVLVHSGTPFFEEVLDTNSNEFLVLRAVGITVLLAGLGLALGVSEAVVAFFVGMAFSSTTHVHDLERLLEPLRDVFAAVFFFWIGLVTDPVIVLEVAWLVLVVVLVTTPTKLLSGFVGGRIYGLDAKRSTRAGLAMVTRGEFSLIIATLVLTGAGTTLDVAVADTLYSLAVGYVLVMSVLGTTLMQYAGPIEERVESLLGSREPHSLGND